MERLCMFDIDNTLSKNGIPINLSILKEAIALCKRHNCLVMTNTNRPFGYPFELSVCPGVKFDGHYGNSDFFWDWIYSREYQNKIRNLDNAREDIPRKCAILIDDNSKTVEKCLQEGFSAIKVEKNGFDKHALEKLRQWLYSKI